MKQMKRLLLTFSLWGCAVMVLHAQNLYVLETNSTQTTYPINNIRSLTFSAGTIMVNKIVGNTTTYSLSDIRYINFNFFTNIVQEDEQFVDKLTLYPNPTNDIFSIDYHVATLDSFHLVIFDIQGKEVYREKMVINADHNVSVNISKLGKGIYLCRLYNEQNSITRKFIKN
jgi:hypothetical protein